MSRTIKIVIAIGALGLCAIAAIGLYFAPRMVRLFTSTYNEWFDEAHDQLLVALNEHARADDRVGNVAVSFYFSMVSPDSESNVLLDVGLDANIACTLRSEDPCDALAEEYARIAAQNYARLDDMAAIRVTVTNHSGIGAFSLNRSVTVIFTSDQWPELLEEPTTDL